MGTPDDNSLSVEEEIAGGLKNAVERGQDLEKAMRSFAAAGYDITKINSAAQIANNTQPIIQQVPVQPEMTPNQMLTVTDPVNGKHRYLRNTQSKNQPLPTSPAVAVNKSSKKLIIVMMVVSALILVVAGLLGLYWDKLFP